MPAPMSEMAQQILVAQISTQEAHDMTQQKAERPLLATPQQIEAEHMLLRLIKDPDIEAAQAGLYDELAQAPASRGEEPARLLKNAIAMWTNSLIMLETATDQPSPAFIWATDDTPRDWLGHIFPGSGIAGDNPDAVYRIVTLDGNGRYVIEGRIDMAHRPSETTIDVTRGDLIPAAPLENQNKNHADMGLQLAFTDDRTFTVGPDGHFRLDLGGEGSGPDHLATADGTTTILVREMLSDWSQRPARLSIRRVDRPEAPGVVPVRPYEDLKASVLRKLPAYVRFWSGYKDKYMGGLAPNDMGGPAARDGGWGFIAGIRFRLERDEAVLITTTDAGAGYMGVQISDPWMITPDARRQQISLNSAQARRNDDGSYSYIVSLADPGIANWIDTAGLKEGFVLLRWQAMPGNADADIVRKQLIRDFRIVKLTELPALPGVPRVTAQERADILARRAKAYASRHE